MNNQSNSTTSEGLQSSMRDQAGKRSQYIARSKAFRSVKNNSSSTKQQSSNIFTACNELPMHNFIKLICETDFTYLLKDRTKVVPENASEIWQTIFDEYLLKIKNEDIMRVNDMHDQLKRLGAQLFLVNASLYALFNGRDDNIIKILRDEGFKIDETDETTYFKSLKLISSKVKGLQVLMNIKQKELESIQKKHTKTKVDETYFIKALIIISKAVGYHVDSKQITVLEFIELQDFANKQMKSNERINT